MWFLYYGISSLVLFYIVLDLSWRFWIRKLSFIPSFPNVPWLGSVPYFTFDGHEVYKMRSSNAVKYGYMYVVWIGSTAFLRIGHVEYIEAILKSQDILTKSYVYEAIREWLGEGLLISKNKKWKERRHALTGAFHFTILNNFVEIFEKHAQNLVSKVLTLSNGNEAIEVQRLVSLAFLDVICETSMGVHINALHSSDSDYVRAVSDFKTLFFKRIFNPLYSNKTLYKLTANGKRYYECLDILHNFTNGVIRENIASRKTLSRDLKDNNEFDHCYRRRKKVLIDILLDLYEKGEIDIDGIREEVDTFMFEGHDTGTSALSWTLYEIGRHAEIQDKIHDEIDDVSSKECSLIDKIRAMKYTECAIKESLRLHPPVSQYDRILQKDLVVEGNTIPSGTVMVIDPICLHMNPAYWEEPTVYNPNRFLGDEKRNPFCYVPFSAGPRNCIGQRFAMIEEKVFLFFILSKFNIKSVQSRDEIKPSVDLITNSVNGINIIFSPR